ncbi:acetyl/propionyl/methylcrotonyl-CoA carboxylase subunit alpha [Lacisediminimonas sp.]|uniref:acetyl/propionyl/methylcrotonyl-CoA carboxylase subunit alpha n=1 Tax=Lacisediminimonas sp. TaxID=3060582 RepID=UPI0027250025|nr:acetyl/propionyl/methylcrotonyl-CoA carboxylase subunit alpha [Lacisediminimonas sp.]MDO8299738.1 acetyl/propionyl/methylcrotonyl-CoA carboxylase subunit alpha [Lacisediminimonas sp.]
MFTKILIANRGEIACRVAATARRLGIKTVAVYSEADAQARHVAACDEAILIGPAAARDSYLRADRILAAARASGAQAIHPGYGFLSENDAFAEACAAAGIVFIGPPASAIRAMGSKSAAKTLMEKAGVPLVPGYHGADQDGALLRRAADAIGYPVLIKASAGGGGKGMRIVETSGEFDAALASCQREAINSFGDDSVLVEKYLTRPRHIEIQVFADSHGECVYLFERDCSVQRRHQKVLEEAPAPGMSHERRRAMGEAAVAAARAVGYVGAGTVEFIANQDGSFYFMEMNTRLQVEHPVTEMITGTDLVEWQLRVACGEPLPCRQQDLSMSGHAIEARVYAENPDKGFLPAIGTLHYFCQPPALEFCTPARPLTAAAVAAEAAVATRPVVRIDSGVAQGDAISPYYDPMIAKLIVWAPTRDQACVAMVAALAQVEIAGLATNVAFLKRLVGSAPFRAADLDTGLIERHRDALLPAPCPASRHALALAAASILAAELRQAVGNSDPWADVGGWRMNSRLTRTLRFDDEVGARAASIAYSGDHWTFTLDGKSDDMLLVAAEGQRLALRLGHETVHGNAVRVGEMVHVFVDGEHAQLHWQDPMAHAGELEEEGGRLTAPMPGKIVALLVEQGASVQKGAPLLIMEAMKMEHTICAPHDGVVAELMYAVGDQVADGAQLIVFALGATPAAA